MVRQTESDLLLSLEQITKTFPNGTHALSGASLRAFTGRIHGLVGANGAGKSTLIKILSGATAPSGGAMAWRGRGISWQTPAAAQAAGIATVHQNALLVASLTVLDNVLLPRGGVLRREHARRDEFEHLLARLDYQIEPDRLAADLSVGERQMVAILQAISRGAKLIVLDEPTASLAHRERQIVFDVIRRLAHTEQTGVIYVSHLLDEILALTDDVTVLRDGEVTLRRNTSDLDEDTLVQAIVGRAVAKERVGTCQGSGGVLLDVEDLEPHGTRPALSLSVRAGEVVGVAGLLGSGRSSLLHSIFGARRGARGMVRVDGRTVGRSPSSAIRRGIALVPEDRVGQGLFGDWEVWRNITLPDLPRLAKCSVFPSPERERSRATAARRRLNIKTGSLDAPVSTLSGGNAQKVVFAKWTLDTTRVLLLDEPTVGVDIGAKEELLNSIREFAESGQAVLIVSAEFDELLRVADRIVVLSRGQIVAERAAHETSEEELLGLASGLGNRAGEEGTAS